MLVRHVCSFRRVNLLVPHRHREFAVLIPMLILVPVLTADYYTSYFAGFFTSFLSILEFNLYHMLFI